MPIWPLGTNFSENQIKIQNVFHSWKCVWKQSSAKWWPFCPGEDDLKTPLSSHIKSCNHLQMECESMGDLNIFHHPNTKWYKSFSDLKWLIIHIYRTIFVKWNVLLLVKASGSETCCGPICKSVMKDFASTHPIFEACRWLSARLQ